MTPLWIGLLSCQALPGRDGGRPDNPRVGQGCGGSESIDCGVNAFCQLDAGFCDPTAQPGVCAERPLACTLEYMPVCGCDGVTYSNQCHAAAAGVNVAAPGECGEPVTPP